MSALKISDTFIKYISLSAPSLPSITIQRNETQISYTKIVVHCQLKLLKLIGLMI